MNKTIAATAAAITVLALGAGACDRPTPAPADATSPATTSSGVTDPAAPTETAGPTDNAPAPVPPESGAAPAGEASFDARNSTFTIEGRPVTLRNGVSVAPAAPGSASSVTVRHLDGEARGDLNNDGREDRAFVVTREGGGSGTFFYVVAAITTAQGYRTTNAFPIGDRIAFQSMTISRNSNELHVNFAGRRPGEPMTARPSVDSVLVLRVTPQGVLQGVGE